MTHRHLKPKGPIVDEPSSGESGINITHIHKNKNQYDNS